MEHTKYPYTIDNGNGELLTFTGVTGGSDGVRLGADGVAQPGAGPPMHVHYLQEEAARVVRGKLGYQVLGGEPQFAGPGELVVWPAGTAHKWWNAGSDELHMSGWCSPPDNVEFFLSTLFASTKANGGQRPGLFDAAFLVTRYRTEFAMLELPTVVRHIVLPAVYVFGNMLGKYRKFKDAPPPIPPNRGKSGYRPHKMTFPVLALAFAAAVTVLRAQDPQYDFIIRNARVVDGTGSPWFRGEIGIRGDQIAAIARRIDAPAGRIIDAANQVVVPGFVDIHVHALGGAGQPPNIFPIVEVPTADNYVRQGVTTLITGPDGFSPIPLRPALERIATAGIAPNIGSFIGHGSVRDAVFGSVNRAPSVDELERMRAVVREGMRDGAFGLSTGLFYVPATFSRTDEVIELAKVAGAMGGMHISHIRDEELDVEGSVRETIAIGEQGGLPTQVTHHKTIGKSAWGKTAATLRLIDEARQRGVDVTVDVYPYPASATTISAALMPTWAQEGTHADVLNRLSDPVTRRRIMVETIRILLEGRGGGDARNVMVSRCDWNASLAGLRLDAVAMTRGKSSSVEDAADTALWLVENGDCGGIYFAISEDDIQRVLRHPASMIASDGQVVMFGRASPHPRSYGSFARVLGRYVRELKVLALEDAVRKMSSYPAQRIGLTDRGILRAGMKADLSIFDPDTIRDMSTFDQPHQYAQGVSTVFINGQVVFENGMMTSARPGRVLYGPAYAP